MKKMENPNKAVHKKTRGKRALAAFGALLCACLFVQCAVPQDASAVPAVAAASLPQEIEPYVVALDPGHGGEDTGAQGQGRNEVDINEQTIDLLAAWLEQDAQYTPVMCRQKGENPLPKERCATADAAGAQLLLSVHANGNEDKNLSGFECYAAPPADEETVQVGRAYHAESMRFATLIVEKFRNAGANIMGESGVYFNYYVEGSELLPAGKDRFAVPSSDLEIRNNLVSFGMVDRPHCPGVLAEQGYLSNNADAAWLSPEGCVKAARLYYEAICAYFGTQPLPN